MGFEVPEDLALRVPAHVKSRLASLRMDPGRHPYPEDSRWRLVRKGIGGCWRASGFAWRKKAFYSVWFVLAALAPGTIFDSLITLGLMPVKRPRFMRLIDGARSEGGTV